MDQLWQPNQLPTFLLSWLSFLEVNPNLASKELFFSSLHPFCIHFHSVQSIQDAKPLITVSSPSQWPMYKSALFSFFQSVTLNTCPWSPSSCPSPPCPLLSDRESFFASFSRVQTIWEFLDVTQTFYFYNNRYVPETHLHCKLTDQKTRARGSQWILKPISEICTQMEKDSNFSILRLSILRKQQSAWNKMETLQKGREVFESTECSGYVLHTASSLEL